MTTLSDSSAVSAIPTTINTAYEKTKLNNKVEIEEYEMVDEPPKTLSPPAYPVNTAGAKDQGMYEDVSPPVAPRRTDGYEDVSLSGEQGPCT